MKRTENKIKFFFENSPNIYQWIRKQFCAFQPKLGLSDLIWQKRSVPIVEVKTFNLMYQFTQGLGRFSMPDIRSISNQERHNLIDLEKNWDLNFVRKGFRPLCINWSIQMIFNNMTSSNFFLEKTFYFFSRRWSILFFLIRIKTTFRKLFFDLKIQTRSSSNVFQFIQPPHHCQAANQRSRSDADPKEVQFLHRNSIMQNGLSIMLLKKRQEITSEPGEYTTYNLKFRLITRQPLYRKNISQSFS